MSRRVGMSKHGKPPRLLQSLNSTKTQGPPSRLTVDASTRPALLADKFATKLSDQDERSIFAAPLSDSDDEGNVGHSNIFHSSDEEEPGRGDIPPTNFKLKGDKRSRPTRGNIDDDGIGPIRDGISAACREPQGKLSSQRLRNRGSETADATTKKARLGMSDKTDELDIFDHTNLNTRRRPNKTYGNQSKSQGPRRNQLNSEAPREARAEAVFKNPQIDFSMADSPDRNFKAPEPIVPDPLSIETGKSFKTFDIPLRSPDSSPQKLPQFKLGINVSMIQEPEFEHRIFRTSDVSKLSNEDGLMAEDLTDRVPLRVLENGEEVLSQPRLFRMPSMVLDTATGSQPESGPVDCLEDSALEERPPSPEVAPGRVCPMCGASVDKDFLQRYNRGKRMNIRMQAGFCRAHKKKSARDEWAQKGYPKIDWRDFDARLAQHHSYLKALLDGQPSYCRAILAEQVRSGKERTLLQAVSNSENASMPGYYGPRGFRVMSENIMDKFSSHLRRIAVTDRLVAARGVTGYVQTVLVPELATRLICEDLGLGEEEARQVMRESVALGDLLNEEVEDVVTLKEGEETL